MKSKTTIICFLAALMIFFFACCTSGPQSPTTTIPASGNQIIIKNFAFSPAEITIKQGDTVVWVNEDSAPHQPLSDSGTEIGSGVLSTGQSYSHTFNSAGTFDYHCAIHPSMKAKIIVQ